MVRVQRSTKENTNTSNTRITFPVCYFLNPQKPYTPPGMDQINKDQIYQKFKKYEFLKRTMQFVLSVSMFSFFLWYSSGFCILPQSFNAYFSTCLLSMLAHTLEKKYMFLVCNGIILAFLAKSSLLSSSPSMSPFDLEFQGSNMSETKVPILASFGSVENAPLMVEEQHEQVKGQEEYHEQVSEVEGQEHDTLFTETEGTENEEVEVEDEGDEEGSGVMVTRDEELANTTLATNDELVNTDELNRKFEEFIRKMKEEIRIEAQRQPIVHA